MGRVILVSGPPCAGKNHHVDQHRAPDDVVLDYDVMGPRAYHHAVDQLAARTQPPTHTTWVIRCLPGPTKRATFASRIRADEHVHLVPDEGELLRRARSRPQPARTVTAIRKWQTDDARDPATTTDPAPRPRTQW